jgi:hypothetical protein
MSTGELMDRTFWLYKKNFQLFVGIASLGAASYLVFELLTISSTSLRAGTAQRVNPFSAAYLGIGFLAGFLIMMAGMAIAHAATVRAVAAVHLGLPIRIVDAYKSLKGRIWRVLGVFVGISLLAVVAVIAAALLIAIVIVMLRVLSIGSGPINGGREAAIFSALIGFAAILAIFVSAMVVWVRYALAIACCVVEDLGVIKSIKRSAALSKGSRFRIFLIYTVFLILGAVAAAALGGLASVSSKLISYVPARLVLISLARFIASALTGPLATIGIALVYYDERVRKEAFDLQLMMNTLDSPAPPTNVAIPVQL